MSRIIYKTGNLFDAPTPRVLVHACNAKGVWGAGVAKQMKDRYPEAFRQYAMFCNVNRGIASGLRGCGTLGYGEDGTIISSIVTSHGFGVEVDAPEMILASTKRAIDGLLTLYKDPRGPLLPTAIHSPRINAGLFNVPWEKTEAVIEAAIRYTDVTWTVWTLESP